MALALSDITGLASVDGTEAGLGFVVVTLGISTGTAGIVGCGGLLLLRW